MSQFDTKWYLAQLAKSQKATMQSNLKAYDKEADLHDAIKAYCKERRWIYFYSRMDRRTTATVGMPDFIILMNGGKFLMVEAKAKKGKLRPQQLGLKVWAETLGHTIHTVFNMEQFNKAAEELI